MLAIELLLENTDRDLAGVEFVASFTGTNYGVRERRLVRNRRCFGEHGTAGLFSPITRNLTIAELFDRAQSLLGRPARLRIHRRDVVLRLRCSGCGSVRHPERIAEAVRPDEAVCGCGAPLRASGHDLLSDFDRAEAGPVLHRRLRDLGVPDQELIAAASDERTIHFVTQ
jgi:hypothetical protein